MPSSRNLIEQYYRTHRDVLLAFANSRLGVRQEAEDVVQDVFLRLLADADRRPIVAETIGSLVHTMVSRQVIDCLRHRQCRREYERLLCGYATPWECRTDSLVLVNDIEHHIAQGLSRLPRPCAEIYRMHIFDNMQVSDISRLLHQDYKAVEYRLGQARRQVRRLLRSS